MTVQLYPVSISQQPEITSSVEQVFFRPYDRFVPSRSGELVSFSTPEVSKYAQRLAEQDLSNAFAKAIRSADEVLGRAKDALVEIKRELVEFVKQYPPYAQASPERISFLNSFSGLRKQIESLVPYMQPDLDSLASPVFKELSQLSQAVSSLADIRDRLNLPEIDQKTPDSEIVDTLPRVEMAIDLVKKFRSDLAGVIQQAIAPNEDEASSLRLLLS